MKGDGNLFWGGWGGGEEEKIGICGERKKRPVGCVCEVCIVMYKEKCGFSGKSAFVAFTHGVLGLFFCFGLRRW